MLKCLLLAILCGAACASVAQRPSEEVDDDGVREFITHTNRSPKKQQYNVWDMIMVRGSDGQLRPWSESRLPISNVDDEQSAVCDDCQVVARYLGRALKDGESVVKFKGVLQMLCGYVSDADERAACLNIVNNLPALVHFGEKVLKDPRAFCAELDLCAGNVPRAVRLLVKYAAARTVAEERANDVLCDECLFAVRELKALVEEKSTEKEVQQAFDALCGYLGGQTAQTCARLVDEYFPLVWTEVEALVSDGRGLCRDLGLCMATEQTTVARAPMYRLLPAAVRTVAQTTVLRSRELPARDTPRLDATHAFLQRVQTRDGTGAGCVLCKIGLTGVVDYFKQNPAALTGVSDKLKVGVCKALPSAYSDDCLDFLHLYLAPVLQMTIEQIKPDAWCNDLRMCKSSDVARIDALSAPQRSAIVCEACTVVATFTQHELGDQAVQDDIAHAIERICDEVPADMTEECQSLVETYAPAVMQTIAQQLNPMVVCPALHMCPQQRAAMHVNAVRPDAVEE